MKKIILALVIVGLVSGVSFAATSAERIITNSVSMLDEITDQSDISGMADTVRGAHAIAIVPSMVKAGFILGGQYGEGLILVRDKGKWYGPSFYNIGGASFGLQIGAQSISLLLAVINERGVEAFVRSQTELGADVGIAAGPVGRRAEAATDAQVKASIYSYSIAKGLFAGVSLQGAVISVSVKRNTEYWGKTMPAYDALQTPATDKRIQPLIRELEELISKASDKPADAKNTKSTKSTKSTKKAK